MELPEVYAGGYFYVDEKRQAPEQFTVDDLLDFSNEDAVDTDAFFETSAGATVTYSSAVTAVGSCNSSVSGGDTQFSGNRSFGESSKFSGDLCVPYDDLAELEWLSNFVEDSFSPEKDLQAFQFLSTAAVTAKTPQISETSSSAETPPLFHHDTPLPGKSRSKRSRAAPGDWTTRLLHLITPNNNNNNNNNNAEAKITSKRESSNNSGSDSSGGNASTVRRRRLCSGGPGRWARRLYATRAGSGTSREDLYRSTDPPRARHLCRRGIRIRTGRFWSCGCRRSFRRRIIRISISF